ncbi:PREDICTED: CLAVATA3/ESR (CLE)-related protein 40 [Tarenaya hassleriana]|uniref:CLAVATA3/ESR (CLE)-related protein 40 n=1 Tax=Tarenaya hassleriana TaxID=28532 RepID=UPI00053C49E1|nr:PREDICTED: CLAVATA3/ESR (CLE)-related protein 40 [Tarenaya hassleriana]
MATTRDIVRVLFIVMFFSMALHWPLARSSRTRFLIGEIEESTETITKKEMLTVTRKKISYGGSAIEVQGRQVPTGPDPLHHNNTPYATP